MFNSVQTAITSVSFPNTLEELRKMGKKWDGIIGQDWITDIDILNHFPSSNAVTWIAPKWLTAGDLLFFYHTKSARVLIKKILIETYQLRSQSNTIATVYTKEEIDKLIIILERVDKISKTWTGSIFALGEVSGRPQRAFDENKHFKGTIYAPIASVIVFESPISSKEFSPFLKIGQNTITPVYGDQFNELKKLIAKHNELPAILANATPGDLNFRDVNRGNWQEISCHKDARFITEAQLRTYLLDHFLHEIKDSKSTVFAECVGYRHNERTGIADYFIRFDNRWMPVEAKLNVLAEKDLRSQLIKYAHLDRFSPTLGSSRSDVYPVNDECSCLVFDQSGIYITHDGEFINCSIDKPLFRREDIPKIGMSNCRDLVRRSL